jgi:iron complex outermembrane recepter protein
MINNKYHRRLLAIVVGSTFAQGASAQLEEIVVTAQKRAESVQEVPIAINAFSGELLANTGITDTEDLGMVTPGLVMNQGGVASSPFIRGLGSQDASAAQDQSVATYIDGVLMNSVTGSAAVLNNIERVEVLKGPQGTLFGRNTTGGVINIITKDPSQDPSLKLRAGYGNYERYNFYAYGTTGITDNTAADLSVFTSDQGEGFSKNVFTGFDGNKRENELAVRSKWKYEGDTVDLTFIGFYEEFSDDKGYVRGVPKGMRDQAGLPAPSDEFDYAVDTDGFADFDNTGLSLRIDKNFDSVDLVSISAWNKNNLDSYTDNDFSSLYWNNARIIFYDEVFTQEFQILSNTDSDLSWIAGAFFLEQESYGRYRIDGPAVGAPVVSFIELNGSVDTSSMAFFGEISYDFTDATTFTAGVRWTEDEREFSSNPGFLLGFPETLDLGAGPMPIAPLLGLPAGTPSPVVTPLADDDKTFDEITYRFVLNHQLTEDVMIYGSFNHGFRSGNYITPVAATPAPFDPEIIDAWEIGFKSDLLDGTLRWNASAFYYEVDDLQLQVLLGVATATINAAEAEIKGFDTDITLQATDELSFQLGASFVDGEYQNFPNAPSNVFLPGGGAAAQTIAIDASGNQITGQPEWFITAGTTYTTVTDSGEWTTAIRAAYNDGFPWEPDGQLVQESYTLVNATLGWRDPSDTWGVQLQGKNLLDEFYSVTTRSVNVNGAFNAAGNPRTYEVSVEYTFH